MHSDWVSLKDAESACRIPARTLRRWAESDGNPPRRYRGTMSLQRRHLERSLERRHFPLPAELGGGPRVLIAEDDRDLRSIISGALRRAWPRAHIRSAKDGHDAKKMLLEWPPDILVTDLRMPGIDGICLAQVIQNGLEFKRSKVLAVTAYDDSETRAEFFESGADEILHKPFEPKDLVASVVRLIGPPRESRVVFSEA